MALDSHIVKEVPGFYRIISLHRLRETPGVNFDCLPMESLPRIDAIDRVIHTGGAVSPGPVNHVERPWYMHPAQDDNLMVLNGTRFVDIYSTELGRMESFEVSPFYVKQDGYLMFDRAAMLVWPRRVFHRIQSGGDGSASVNFAVHYEDMDIRTNFNIYELDTVTGVYSVLREGFRDQF